MEILEEFSIQNESVCSYQNGDNKKETEFDSLLMENVPSEKTGRKKSNTINPGNNTKMHNIYIIGAPDTTNNLILTGLRT